MVGDLHTYISTAKDSQSYAGIVSADVIAKYGTDYISSVILLASFPYRSMHPEIVHPVVLSLIPGFLSDDMAQFSKALPEFAFSCFAPGTPVSYADLCKWTGAVATHVSLLHLHPLSDLQHTLSLASTRSEI